MNELNEGESVEQKLEASANTLFPLVYQQLKQLAEERLKYERSGHTLQATALVHEVYLRLGENRKKPWESEAHFYVAASEAIRRILIDHARSKAVQKRGGHWTRLPKNLVEIELEQDSELIVALEDALSRLEVDEPDVFQVVRMRFYVGLSGDRTAEVLGISARSVDRRWSYARAWLLKELQN